MVAAEAVGLEFTVEEEPVVCDTVTVVDVRGVGRRDISGRASRVLLRSTFEMVSFGPSMPLEVLRGRAVPGVS